MNKESIILESIFWSLRHTYENINLPVVKCDKQQSWFDHKGAIVCSEKVEMWYIKIKSWILSKKNSSS